MGSDSVFENRAGTVPSAVASAAMEPPSSAYHTAGCVRFRGQNGLLATSAASSRKIAAGQNHRLVCSVVRRDFKPVPWYLLAAARQRSEERRVGNDDRS